MTSQNWRLKKLIRINMRDYHFYNLKMLYSGYLSQIYFKALNFYRRYPLKIVPTKSN